MSTPGVCEVHGKGSVSRCTWCARPICESCIEEADGHRLCDSCAGKLAKDKPLVTRRKRERQAGPVRNVDETLTKEQLRLARKRFLRDGEEGEEEVPRWPRLQ